MSIDAIIGKAERQANGDIVLELIPGTRGQPTGQNHMTIIGATVMPEVGAIIWGGGNSVFIQVPDSVRHLEYKREGYTQLIEDFGWQKLEETKIGATFAVKVHPDLQPTIAGLSIAFQRIPFHERRKYSEFWWIGFSAANGQRWGYIGARKS